MGGIAKDPLVFSNLLLLQQERVIPVKRRAGRRRALRRSFRLSHLSLQASGAMTILRTIGHIN
jgi:hypothetical protein